MADTRVRETAHQDTQIAITRAVHQAAEPLPAPERGEEFGARFARFGDARVVQHAMRWFRAHLPGAAAVV